MSFFSVDIRLTYAQALELEELLLKHHENSEIAKKVVQELRLATTTVPIDDMDVNDDMWW